MKLATWNVNSVLARLPVVLRWLEREGPDVLCLQETKCVDERFPSAAIAELGYKSETFGQPTYNGVAILSRVKLSRVERGLPDDAPGAQARVISATAGGARIVNVYIPNGGYVGSDKYAFKLEWMKRLRAYFDSNYDAEEKVLLCGDFNVAPEDRDVHNPKLWEGRVLFSKPERAALMHINEWVLQIASARTTRKRKSSRGGTIVRERFAATWVCASTTSGYRKNSPLDLRRRG